MNHIKTKTEITKLIEIIKREIYIIDDYNYNNKLDDPNLILYAKILRGSVSDIVNILKDKWCDSSKNKN